MKEFYRIQINEDGTVDITLMPDDVVLTLYGLEWREDLEEDIRLRYYDYLKAVLDDK